MNKLRNLLRPKVLISGLIAAVIIALGAGTIDQSAHAANGRDCDNNAIISCGYGYLGAGSDGLLTKFQQNGGELQAIYGNFGFTNINDYVNRAKHVTVYRDGTTKTDDGTIVATGTNSLGRQSFGNPNRHPINIGGKTYYYSSTQNSFASGTNSIDGYALFNADDHSMIMGTMKACGNPFWGNSPGYKCQMLQQTKLTDNSYSYLATPYTKNGATVSKIVYDFGDGSSQTVTSNFGASVNHTYAPGTYTARATVYFSVNGKEVSDTRQECTKPVEVAEKPKPVYVCTSLVAKQVTGSRTKFTFTATAQVKDATLQTGKFHFGDNTSSNAVNANGTTVTTEHEYVKEGTYTVTVDLAFDKGNDNGNAKCKTTIKVTPKTCADVPKEELPNHPECQTCANTPTLPECQPPKKDCTTNPEMEECKELPKTGPAEIIGSAIGLSTITGAGVYYRNTRRDLLNKIFKR